MLFTCVTTQNGFCTSEYTSDKFAAPTFGLSIRNLFHARLLHTCNEETQRVIGIQARHFLFHGFEHLLKIDVISHLFHLATDQRGAQAQSQLFLIVYFSLLFQIPLFYY